MFARPKLKHHKLFQMVLCSVGGNWTKMRHLLLWTWLRFFLLHLTLLRMNLNCLWWCTGQRLLYTHPWSRLQLQVFQFCTFFLSHFVVFSASPFKGLRSEMIPMYLRTFIVFFHSHPSLLVPYINRVLHHVLNVSRTQHTTHTHSTQMGKLAILSRFAHSQMQFQGTISELYPLIFSFKE